jgi:hypothetical protein
VDAFLLGLFQQEAKLQCQFILFAVEQLKEVQGRDMAHHVHYEREREAAKRAREESDLDEIAGLIVYSERLHPLRHGYPRDSGQRIWMALQTIASSAANLSKLFWGSQGKRENARRPLRESLNVPEDSCLQSTDLRNSFEHFDERIERRFADTEVRGFIGRNIGPPMFISTDGAPLEPKWRFGEFDPDTGQLIFWTKSINVFDVAAEARRILKVAEVEAEDAPG